MYGGCRFERAPTAYLPTIISGPRHWLMPCQISSVRVVRFFILFFTFHVATAARGAVRQHDTCMHGHSFTCAVGLLHGIDRYVGTTSRSDRPSFACNSVSWKPLGLLAGAPLAGWMHYLGYIIAGWMHVCMYGVCGLVAVCVWS